MKHLSAGILLGLAGGAGLTAGEQPLLSTVLAVDSSWAPEQGVRDADADLRSSWIDGEARLFFRPHAAVRAGLGVAVNRTTYASTGLSQALPEVVQHYWLRLPVAVMVHPHWGFSLQASIGCGVADEVSWSDGRQWQIQAGPLYRRDEDLLIALLVDFRSHIDDDPSILVFPSLYWRFHP